MFEQSSLPENRYSDEVKRALRAQGFWGQSVKKFTEELHDHFRAKNAKLKEQGYSEQESCAMTAKTLGEPRTLALEWSRTLCSKSWMGRHPWLAGVMGFVGIWVFSILSIVTLGTFFSGGTVNAPTRQMVYVFCFFINWTPSLFGLFFLVRKTIRSPLGWRPLSIQCFMLGLATSAWGFSIFFGPSRGMSMTIVGQTWTTLWAIPLASYLHLLHEIGGDQSGIWVRLWLSAGLFKLLFPLLACWGTRWIIIRSNKLKGWAESAEG